ncbi:MAG: hypothetical protein L0I81_00530 [Lactococcus lactis]|uniref:hypothetical protein n=1 Tax=Tetragenococcus muriaticus TaxID=64642 RepID=UPI000414296F|nr:hypothetical protein [Tetragenococcus muriaticus]MDN6139321.1 hypothetical protein [Tetragenococcus koreensis]MDN6167367.1 hypothetical protein [Lactococcus lactis]MDN6146136.1 hypothetical protein [Tetragenococcus koreensis]MDN6165635.1 hypothetical protein [Tetragenococcus koreensis]MDN6183741.1 hypothetical protein [Lactococcus lactis]
MKKKRTFFTTLYLSLLCFFIFSTHSSQATTITSDNSQTATTDSSLSLSDSGQEAMELRLLDNPVVTFLLEHLKINKPTIFAIGVTTIGLIFLIMSLFLPSLAKQKRLNQKNNKTAATSGQHRPQKKFSGKGIVAIIGLLLVLIGVIVQTVNQMN